jgi:hypothetical protein
MSPLKPRQPFAAVIDDHSQAGYLLAFIQESGQANPLQGLHGRRGKTIAAWLVTRKGVLIDEGNVEPLSSQSGSACTARGSCADHRDVSFRHG